MVETKELSMEVKFKYMDTPFSLKIPKNEKLYCKAVEYKQLYQVNCLKIRIPDDEFAEMLCKFIEDNFKKNSMYKVGVHPVEMGIFLDDEIFYYVADKLSEENKQILIRQILKEY